MKKMKVILGLLLVAMLLITAAAAMASTLEDSDPIVTAAENLVYSGGELELVTATPNGKWIWYQKDADYVKAVPTGKDADNYSVAWGYSDAGDGEQPDIAPDPATITVGGTVDAVINKKGVTLSLSATATSFVYNGDVQKPAITDISVGGTLDGDKISVSACTYSDDSSKNAGPYTVTVTGLNDESTSGTPKNYSLPASASLTYSISRQEVTLSWSGSDAEYDKQSHEISCTSEPADAVDVSIEKDGAIVTSVVDAGKYTAKATLKDSDNYAFASGTLTEKTIIISAKEIALVWSPSPATFEYDKAPHCPTAEADGLISGDSCNVTVEGGQTNAGKDYTATAIELDNPNYKLPSGATTKFTIEPIDVTLTWTNGTPYTYSGEQQNPTAVVNGLLSGDTCDPVYKSVKSIDQGNYTYEVTGLSNTNYQLSSGAETTAEYVIDPQEAKLEWDNNAELTYNGKNQYPSATVSNLVPGDSCNVTVEATDAVHVGSYSAVATELSNNNYKLPSWSDRLKTFQIVALEAQLKWNNTEFTFDGDKHIPTAEVTNLQTGDSGKKDECEVTVSGEATAAGTYTAKATELSNKDYKLGQTEQQFVIKAADISKATIETIEDQTYTGSEITPKPVLTDEATGTLKEDTDYSLGYSPNTNVGEVTVTITGLGNYEGSSATTKFEIVQKEIKDEWITKIEDQTYTGSKITPELTITDKDRNEALVLNKDYKVTYTDNINVADKPVVTVEGIGNYKSTVETTFNIVPKAVTLTWTNESPYTYNGGQQNPTAEVEGVISVDECAPVYEELKSINVGEYTYKVTGVSNENYKLDESAIKEASYEIVAKAVTLTWTNESPYTYNGGQQNPTAEVEGVISGDECAPVYEKLESINVGKYTYKATGVSNENYKLDESATKEASYEIVPKTIQSGWVAEIGNQTYSGSGLEPTVTVTDPDLGELDLDTDYSVSYKKNVNVPHKPEDKPVVTITGEGNYDGTITTTFNIVRKHVAVIDFAMKGPPEESNRLGGPKEEKYHTILIKGEKNEPMKVTITGDGIESIILSDRKDGDEITIKGDAIEGNNLNKTGEKEYKIKAEYNNKDNLTNGEETPEAKEPDVIPKGFTYDKEAKPITVNTLYNRLAKGVVVNLPEGYSLVKFTSTGAGNDFIASNPVSLYAGNNVTIPFNIGENPKLNSSAKGGHFTGVYEDFVGNPGTVDTQDILKARGTIEIVSVEPPINGAGRIGNTPTLTFVVRMSADGGYEELVGGAVFGSRTLTQGEQTIVVSASSLAPDATNTPGLAFDDLEGSATFRSFIYDPVCDEPVLTMVPYEGFYYLMGLAEPYCQLVMEVNGERITGSSDAFGVFALKMPLTEAGDTITLRLTDQAGNTTTVIYRVGTEEEGTTMTAFMGGRVYTNAHNLKTGVPDWTMVLTASLDDLKAGNVNVPIYAGNMVSIGTMSVNMDQYNNLSYSYTVEDGVKVLSEKFIANTQLDKDAFIAGLGIAVDPSGTLIPDIQKGKVYLCCKMTVKVPAEMLKNTFQVEKIKDSEMKKQYRNIQNGRLN